MYRELGGGAAEIRHPAELFIMFYFNFVLQNVWTIHTYIQFVMTRKR